MQWILADLTGRNRLKHGWILALIEFSLKASVAKYDNSWWKQKNGIPTGGRLCVQLANRTVFYVMSEKVYKVPGMMEKILDIKRFIDDGGGLHLGNEEEFEEWLRKVNSLLRPFGLYIDEYPTIKQPPTS